MTDDDKKKLHSELTKIDPCKTEKTEVIPVAKGKVATKKSGLGKKIFGTFFLGNSKDVENYTIHDVIIPTVREALFRTVTDGLSIFMFGETKKRNQGTYRNYQIFSQSDVQRRSEVHRTNHQRSRDERFRNTHNFESIEFELREDADSVLEYLENRLELYDMVSVAEFYQACDITPEHTDVKWGWEKLGGSRIERLRGGGYCIILPRPIPLPI